MEEGGRGYRREQGSWKGGRWEEGGGRMEEGRRDGGGEAGGLR